MTEYRTLSHSEINRALFRDFIRRQIVTDCWRKEQNKWVIRNDPFVDDWTEADYRVLLESLRHTAASGGYVCGAFFDGSLKGFASVEPVVFGGEHGYLDLSNLHVSEDVRGQGIGAALFRMAKTWAREQGGKKLYLSAHSAVESQAFYQKMGCVEAQAYCRKHVDTEPFDCQLECLL